MRNILFALMLALLAGSCSPSKEKESATPFREGIIAEEFAFNYTKSPFRSCHAATMAENNEGILCAAWFGGLYEKQPDCKIYFTQRINGEWTKQEPIADGKQEDGTIYATWNPVLFQVPGGELQLYYKVGPHPSTWWGMMKTSADGGATWSDAMALPQGIIGPVKNKPELINGKLISPTSVESKEDGWQVYFEISDDMGKTWHKTAMVNDGHDTIAIQPSILHYADGRLQALCRSKNRAMLSTWSNDGGETWSKMEKLRLPQNNSGTDAVTLQDGRQLLVYNHVLPPCDHFKGGRTPINLAISDDGINWDAALVLEDTPDSKFAYPAIIQTSDGLVHIMYTWNRIKMKHFIIDPSKICRTPIVNGEWPTSR
ncbi:MAG: exo-alpha-sialidase [Mangrovibacterium sp.]